MSKIIVTLMLMIVVVASLAPSASATRHPYGWRPIYVVAEGDDQPIGIESPAQNNGTTVNSTRSLSLLDFGTFLMIFFGFKGNENGNEYTDVTVIEGQNASGPESVSGSNSGN